MQLNKDFFSQPYPHLINRWRVSILISCFIIFFIVIFQPFGLASYQAADRYFVFAGYGLLVFVILWLNLFGLPYVFKKSFDRKKWTVLKQILWFSWILFTIGIGNFFYTSYFFPMFWSLKGFLLFQFFTLVIGIIPIVVIIMVNRNKSLADSLKEASSRENITSKADEEIVHLLADNEKDQLQIPLANFLYMEAAGNYVQIHYLQEAEVKNTLLRSSLKRLEFQLIDFPSLVKCHRSFIVNTHQVKKLLGNSQNLKLSLPNGIEVPVSRNYARYIKDIKS